MIDIDINKCFMYVISVRFIPSFLGALLVLTGKEIVLLVP